MFGKLQLFRSVFSLLLDLTSVLSDTYPFFHVGYPHLSSPHPLFGFYDLPRTPVFLSSVNEARCPDVNGVLGNFAIVRCCFVCFSTQMDGNFSLFMLSIILSIYYN